MWKTSSSAYKLRDIVFFNNNAFVDERDLKKVYDIYCCHDDDEPWAGTIVDIPHFNFVVVDMGKGVNDILLYADKIRRER